MKSRNTTVAVAEASQAGEARRTATQLSAEFGFSEVQQGKAAIIASELATNLSRYAKGGEILLQASTVGGQSWLDVISLDRGPGIDDVARCLTDGFSTGGSSGTGLGAVSRQANTFDIYSLPSKGTAVFARIAATESSPKASKFDWATTLRSAPGETECGDAWAIEMENGRLSLMIADGLGHGPEAAKAARESTAAFQAGPFATVVDILDQSHQRMRGTRGAAVATAQVEAHSGQVRFCGIGNISACLRSIDGAERRGLVSHNGTVGVQMRKPQQFDYDLAPGGLLIMHSDGLQSRWNLDDYPGLIQRHPGLIAAILLRDFTRGRDDVTVSVVRRRAS